MTTSKPLREEGHLLTEEFYAAARPRLVEHVRSLQAARSLAALFETQRALIVEFGARQKVLETLPAERSQVANEIKRLVAAKAAPSDVAALQGRLDIIRRQERVLRALMHALRSVADGVAWKALRYDRLGIAVLGRGRRVGRFAFGVGFDAELAHLSAYWDKGVLALHNDLTNVLRHGDLTLVRWPRSGDLEADVVEVKAGRVPDPGSPQLRRIADAIAFLQKGEHSTYAEGQPLAAVRVPVRYRTFLANLRDVLATARRDGFAWTAPSPCLAIMASYLPRASGHREVVTSGFAKMQRRLRWWEQGQPPPFVWTSSLRRVRDRRQTISSTAPFAIFPVPAEDIADLLLGYLDYAVYLNADVLERIFAAHGLRARVARQPKSDQLFLSAASNEGTINVPPPLREQMLTELTTPAALIAAVKGGITSAAKRAEGVQFLVVFADESSAWERRA